MSHQILIPDGAPEGAAVLEVYVKVGDTVTEGTMLIEIEGDKANFQVESDVAGTISELPLKVGDKVSTGTLVASISVVASAGAAPAASPAPVSEAAVASPAPAPSAAAVAVAAPSVSTNGAMRSSPLAKEMAKAFGVDIASVKSSSGNRVSKEDVIAHIKQNSSPAASPSSGGGGGPMKQKPLPDFSKFGGIRVEKMSRINIATADNMSYAWSTIPHAWIQEKADITDVERFRQQYKDRVKAAGGSLTMTAILTKACASALRKFPIFNASIDLEKQEIIYKDFVNVSIAVDTERGLMVPVIRDADRKGLTEISIELTQISERTRTGQNKPEDFQGATFTISNIGGIGCSAIMPIVNPPQVAILGVTASQEEAKMRNGAWEARAMMPMTIGFDHRVINGADTARFLRYLKEMLEDPFLMQF